MKRLMTLAAMLSCAALAYAQQIPATENVEVPYGTHVAGSASVNWPVPSLGNGRLLTLQPMGITNAATVAVYHLVPYGSGRYITNAVEAAAANGTLYAYVGDATYTTNTVQVAKPVWLVPGDYLRFVLSDTNGQATVVLRHSVN